MSLMALLDWSQCPAVESVPGKVSGAWVLKNTRIPVPAIFENLEAGTSLNEIMEWFDGLDREQVKAVIAFAARSLDKAPEYALQMLILFDQGPPVPLRRFLKGHAVRTTWQQGWDRLENGKLLAAAESAGFGLLLTTDKNLYHQRNLTGRRLAIIVLGKQQWPDLQPHVQHVVDAVNSVLSGSHIELDFPE